MKFAIKCWSPMILQWETFKAQYKISVVDLEEVMGVPGNPPFEVVTKKFYLAQPDSKLKAGKHACL